MRLKQGSVVMCRIWFVPSFCLLISCSTTHYALIKIHDQTETMPLSITRDQKTWTTNGTVYTIVRSRDKVYIGGDFTRVGPYTGSGVPISSSTGTTVPAFPKINGGSVYASCSDGMGGRFVGGQFTSIDGIKRRNIAHILSSGNLDSAWNPDVRGSVNSLALSGITVYVGGGFSQIGGQDRNGIAALNAITGNVLDWNPDANSSIAVYALAVNCATVYAGGDFTNIGGESRNRIAALDSATGKALAWNPNSNKQIFSLAISGSTIYAGGNFDTIGGQQRSSIAALDATTGNATAWNPNPINGGNFGAPDVYSILVSGTMIYVGGCFIKIGGQFRNGLAALDATTGNATGWIPNANSCICALAMSGKTIYAGGFFTIMSGQSRNYLAALDAVTGSVLAWNPNANNYVRSLSMSRTAIYVGGDFTGINGQTRNHLTWQGRLSPPLLTL